MRIIAGKFKGRQLVDFDAGHIRPTTDRVKETLFNKLMGDVEGARILDLFSGTGNLALECISRGAEHVELVEMHKKSVQIIRENFAKLKIAGGYKLNQLDVFRYIQGFSGTPFDVVLADPPFTEKLAHDVAARIGQAEILKPGGILVIEASSKERMDENYPGLNRLDQRTFGDKHLNFFEKVNNGESDLPR